MIDDKSVLAIVPARGGSKGLPGKNKRLLCGKPLVAWPIEAALGAACVDKVLCTTDDPEIRDIALENGAQAPFLRPAYLASDSASSIGAILHAVDHLADQGEHYDYVVVLEPTSPLTTSADVDAALKTLYSRRADADSIVGISRVESTHPEYDVRLGIDGRISPYMAPDFKSLKRRQEIETLHFLEGSLYITSTQALRAEGGFYHARTLGYVVPRWKSIEIDELVDFLFVETLLGNLDQLAALDAAANHS
ncbi:cytidylyltransferase domain-containing protein [Chromobacterium vaccinii]|uniref:acylneuraminate cytidylyltransferase family protein n=1 Tax=Chromobacterium vaccinii TaxID=1108595 RepID=UPI001E56211B|nr:acylneuraminate cytidylyltransferase family protein [Chromobacterium vaccinii]MCD4498926.1 acylneuraminate cytidylyltransferase family protein [Chromobacterium vaccinii]